MRNAPTVRFEAIDQDNWEDCVKLEVQEEQRKMVAPNWYSIIQAAYDESYTPLSIYYEDMMVGFFMYGKDPDDGLYWIVRLMIDKRYQGRGYGEAAIRLGLELIKRQEDCSPEIVISYKPDNEAAGKLYERVGFVPTGRIIEGETEARYKVLR